MGKSKGRKVTLKKDWMGFKADTEVPYEIEAAQAKKMVDRGVAYYSNKAGGKPHAKPKHRMVDPPSNE